MNHPFTIRRDIDQLELTIRDYASKAIVNPKRHPRITLQRDDTGLVIIDNKPLKKRGEGGFRFDPATLPPGLYRGQYTVSYCGEISMRRFKIDVL